MIAFLAWLFAGRCAARAVQYGEVYHCDERAMHTGPHRTDRGMYDVAWTDDTHAV